MSGNDDAYPLVDLSDIPGCESPPTFRSSSSSSRLATSLATKKRISSIFSSASTYDSDDDPFDLKASARKSKAKPVRQSIVNTARLIDIDETVATLNSPDIGLTDWNLMKAEAHAIAGEIKSERKINFNELLNKSPLTGSPLCMTSEASALFPSSPTNSPRKAFSFDEEEPMKRVTINKSNIPKENAENVREVFLDDQLEKAIGRENKDRKPLSSINHKPLNFVRRMPLKPPMTPTSSRLPMTPSSKAKLENNQSARKLPMKLSMTPSRLQTPSLITPIKSKAPERPSSTLPRRSLSSSTGPSIKTTKIGNVKYS